jgi:putative RNA 2'-phosphotransferase
VHLSKTAADARAAGSVRTPNPVILEIDTEKARGDGIVIMQAGKTVYLADRVPPEFLRRLAEAPPTESAPAANDP